MDNAPLLPAGLLPPPGLFAVLCWPFLVALLLWASGRIGQGRPLALAGAAMSLFALSVFPHNLPIVQTVALGLESCTPLLLFLSGSLGAHLPEPVNPDDPVRVAAYWREAGVAERLPFLVTGFGLMALCVQSVLAVTVCLGAGAVVLAWWDGRGTRRARSAWNMVRLRLCGVILSALGAALLQALPLNPDSVEGARLGAIMLVVGLGMLAGLGETSQPAPAFALLETGLRFGALFLLLQLAVSPLTQELTLLAGLASLWLTVLGSGRHSAPLLSLLTGLGALAAGARLENTLLILFCAALLCCTLQRLEERKTVPSLANWCVLPVLLATLIVLGQAARWEVTVLATGALALELRGLSLQSFVSPFLPAENEPAVGEDEHEVQLQTAGRRMALGLGGALLALALTEAFVPGGALGSDEGNTSLSSTVSSGDVG